MRLPAILTLLTVCGSLCVFLRDSSPQPTVGLPRTQRDVSTSSRVGEEWLASVSSSPQSPPQLVVSNISETGPLIELIQPSAPVAASPDIPTSPSDVVSPVEPRPIFHRVEHELPEPPVGREWPFFITIYNAALSVATPVATPEKLTAKEEKAIVEAVKIFEAELTPLEPDATVEPPSEVEVRKIWVTAEMRAQEYLRRTLGYGAYNALSRTSRQ
jgi:hypothetical protein